MEPHLDCTVDVFRVGDLSEQARREGRTRKRAKLYEQIVDLYRGRLLPQSASEQWVEGVSVRLHGQYPHRHVEPAGALQKWGESTRIISLCNHALELDPYEERLYLEEIVALEALGRHNEAQKLARRGTAMGCLHHAIEPGRAGSAYRQMRQADRNMEGEVAKLVAALPDTENAGACICDFETFKEAYRVQRGVGPLRPAGVPGNHDGGPRSGCRNPTRPPRWWTSWASSSTRALRQCDVAARYTETQYVIMLCGSAAETGSSPLERIKGVVLPRARSWPLPAQLQPVRARSQSPTAAVPAASAAKTVKYFRPAAKVSRLGGF